MFDPKHNPNPKVAVEGKMEEQIYVSLLMDDSCTNFGTIFFLYGPAGSRKYSYAPTLSGVKGTIPFLCSTAMFGLIF